MPSVPKPVRILCPEYLEFIRHEPCLCGCGSIQNDPHHQGAHGTGTKVSDFRTVPLHREVHRKINAVGWSEQRVADTYGINWAYSIRRLNEKFMEGVLVGRYKIGNHRDGLDRVQVLEHLTGLWGFSL